MVLDPGCVFDWDWMRLFLDVWLNLTCHLIPLVLSVGRCRCSHFFFFWSFCVFFLCSTVFSGCFPIFKLFLLFSRTFCILPFCVVFIAFCFNFSGGILRCSEVMWNRATLFHVGKLLLYRYLLLPCEQFSSGSCSSPPTFRIVRSFLKSSLMIPTVCPWLAIPGSL